MDLMLASKYDPKRAQKILDTFGSLYVQEKYDGARVYVNQGTLYTRNGKEIHIANESLKSTLCEISSHTKSILDGELLVCDVNGNYLPRKTGNGIINSHIKGNTDPNQEFRLFVFDYINPDKKDVPYVHRLSNALALVHHYGNDVVKLVNTELAKSIDHVDARYKHHLSLGHEGIMVKSPMNLWEPKRVKDVMKLKEEKTADLEVVGAELGSGKYTGMIGSLVCTTADKRILVNVGSGLTDELRKAIPPNGTIVEVKYNQVIQNEHGDYSLFLPIFVGYRNDKTEANKLEELL